MEPAKKVSSVTALAKSDAWAEIKERGAVEVGVGEDVVSVELATQATKIGALRLFVCPSCGRRCKDLFAAGDKLGCRKCLSVRHPDQQLSSSRWDRDVVRPARQVVRISARLERRDLERNDRRRLRRRRDRLLEQIQEELARRRLDHMTKTLLTDPGLDEWAAGDAVPSEDLRLAPSSLSGR